MDEIKTVSTLEQLSKAIDFLRAYYTTNAEVLNTNDEYELSSVITSMLLMKKEAESIARHINYYEDEFDGQLYLVHAADMCDLMNIATYDTYGKLYVEHNGSVSFEQYATAVNEMNNFSRSALELGYDIVGDLYADNEEQGCHGPDGTIDPDKL